MPHESGSKNTFLEYLFYDYLMTLDMTKLLHFFIDFYYYILIQITNVLNLSQYLNETKIGFELNYVSITNILW